MSEPFSRSVQKRIEAQIGEKLYTEAELQSRIAAAFEAAATIADSPQDACPQPGLRICEQIRALTPASAVAAVAEIERKARVEEAKWWELEDWASLDSHQHVCITAKAPQQGCVFCERIAALAKPAGAGDGGRKT